MSPLYAAPVKCHRFCIEGDDDTPAIKFHDAATGDWRCGACWREGISRREQLRARLDNRQRRLLHRLYVAGLVVETEPPTRRDAPPTQPPNV